MDGTASPDQSRTISRYALTPEQIAEAKREEEEFRRIQERAEAERWMNSGSHSSFDSTKLAFIAGGAVFLALMLWTVHVRGGSVGWVLTGGVGVVAGIWLLVNIDAGLPMLRVSGAGLLVTGLWCLVLGLFMSAEDLEMLDPGHSAEVMAEQLQAIGAPAREWATPPSQDWSSTHVPVASAPTQAPANLGTGGTIQVTNNFNCTQHVFIDGRWVGTVGVSATRSWDVSPGSHQLVCADSNNINDNPVRQQMNVARGEVAPFNVYVTYN